MKRQSDKQLNKDDWEKGNSPEHHSVSCIRNISMYCHCLLCNYLNSFHVGGYSSFGEDNERENVSYN